MNLGKNTKLVTWDGKIWYFQFYDCDTSLGLDNSGNRRFDVDIEMEASIFNTSGSLLWTKIFRVFENDLKVEYAKMRNGNFTLDNIMKYLYEDQICNIPKSVYNSDMQTKYLQFGSSYIYACHGDSSLHMRRWLRERLLYMDTMMDYMNSSSDYITIRANTLEPIYLDMQTYSPCYLKIKFFNDDTSNSGEVVHRIRRGETVRFNSQLHTATDQEIIIYGGSNLKSIGDISNLNPSTMLISNAYKLTKLECHSSLLITMDVSELTYLREIDIEGCINFGSDKQKVLNISNCSYLTKINAKNTQLTAIQTNQSGGNLEEIYLPSSTTIIQIANQKNLKILGIPYSKDENAFPKNLATVSITNCPNIEKLNTSENEETSKTFIAFKYVQNLTLYNSLQLTEMNFKDFNKLKNVTLSAMPQLESLGFNDMVTEGESSTIKSIKISGCPLITSLEMNVSDETYSISFAKDAIIDISEATSIQEIRCNYPIQGLSTIILPSSIKDLKFTNDFNINKACSIVNIWSYAATHANDNFKGLDFLNLNIRNINLELLINVPKAINFRLSPTNINPNFNKNRDGINYSYLQPVGTLDLSNYVGSLAKFFNGVDLDKLKVVCDKTLPQTDYSYCLYNAKFNDLTNVEEFLRKVGCISNASYMFAETIIDNVDIMEQVELSENAILDYMFSGTKVRNIDNLTLATNIKSARGFVSRCKNLTSANNVTLSINGPVSHFFDGCTNLNNISGLTIRNVTAIDYILNNCLRISANLRSWDLSKCDDMSYALAGTQIENNVDLSNLKLGSSSCRYNNLFGENLDNISINLSNSQVNVNAIETIIEGISNVSLNLTGIDLSKRTNFDGWFENCDLIEIILDNITWSDKGIHFNRAFKNTRISKDFLLPITTTRAEECFSNIPTLTHIHSNWEQKFKDYVVTNEWGEVLSRETLIPTNCYAGNNAITHCDDIDLGVSEFVHGLDQIPIEWGGNGFTKGMAGIYVFTIPSDNYTINFDTIASRQNFVTLQGIVSWGDGTPKQTYSDFESSGSVTHTYAKAGRYVVKGHLHFTSGYSNNTKSCLTVVAAVPEGQPSNIGGWIVTSSFAGCNNLVSANVTGLINKHHTGTLGVQMFDGCSSLTQITGLETWDVSNITTLSWTFYNIPNIRSITGLRNWNISKLQKLDITFSGCKQLRQLDIESWNTSNLKALSNAFGNCLNLDLSILKDWDVSNVEYLNGAFSGNLGTDFSWLENWNISSKLKDISNMINGAINLESLDLSRWNCPNIENMASSFYNCKKLRTLNISNIGNIGMIEEPDDTSDTLSNFFGYCLALEDMILGDNFTISSDKQLNGRYLFASTSALTTETLVSILNHLADRTGKTTNNLYFPTQLITKLSADQMSIATNKNWTIVQV